MNLNKEQLETFHRNGYLLIENVFCTEELALIEAEILRLKQIDCQERILEKDGSVRSFFAPEKQSNILGLVTRLKKMVKPAESILDNQVYIHQSKLNTKQAFIGDKWDWHQDYIFWQKDDGMPSPDVLNAMIYVNEVNEFNGPLFVIPGSHLLGVVEDTAAGKSMENESEWFKKYQQSKSYMSALTVNLKYTINQQTVTEWVDKNGIRSTNGAAGSVLFFHGNIFHASPSNVSPWNRDTFLVTYNSTDNKLKDIENPRPTFIANRDFTPIKTIDDSSLLDLAGNKA
ncbi:phytanoyl-CoA dioxygenase family protein [Flavitalea sp.]|nr:phytanoyl-CoA dioxygenase family protein [Flavitalea sp.]